MPSLLAGGVPKDSLNLVRNDLHFVIEVGRQIDKAARVIKAHVQKYPHHLRTDQPTGLTEDAPQELRDAESYHAKAPQFQWEMKKIHALVGETMVQQQITVEPVRPASGPVVDPAQGASQKTVPNEVQSSDLLQGEGARLAARAAALQRGSFDR